MFFKPEHHTELPSSTLRAVRFIPREEHGLKKHLVVGTGCVAYVLIALITKCHCGCGVKQHQVHLHGNMKSNTATATPQGFPRTSEFLISSEKTTDYIQQQRGYPPRHSYRVVRKRLRLVETSPSDIVFPTLPNVS